MRMFSERQRKILALVLASGSFVPGRDIAEQLGVSLRTVQSEVARINAGGRVLASSNRGYAIEPRSVEEVRRALADTAPEPAESIDHRILKIITKSDGALTVDDLSEALFMSAPAIERRLRKLRPRFEAHGLHLMKRGGFLQVEGAEADKRALMGALVAQEASASFSSYERIAAYLDDMDIDRVRAIVASSIDAAGLRIKCGYEQSLITSISIALYRMRANSYIPDTACAVAPETTEQRIAREICRRYAAHRRIAPGRGDLDYLSSLLVGQLEQQEDGLPGQNGPHPAHTTPSDFMKTIERIVNRVFESFLLHVEFSQSLYTFSMHVQALIERQDGQQTVPLDALENIKMNCPFVYELSLLIANELEDRFDIRIADGELGFICIHVGMLIENTLAADRVSIVVVGDRYHGISQRICEQIALRFSDIATAREYDEASGEDVAQADVVVTTRKELAQANGAVLVSPFFTPADYLVIENAIGVSLRESRARNTRALLEPFFADALFIRADRPLDKHEVIDMLGSALQREGIVDAGFTQSVLRRETLSSTCFFESFAVPHSVEMNARRTMVAVMLDPHGITWDASTIKVVTMIAVCQEDRKRFMEIYDALVRALCDEARVRRAERAEDLRAFLDIIAYGS